MMKRLAVFDPTVAVLDPTGKKNQRSCSINATGTRPVPPSRRAMFLADLACLGDSAPYVARGLLRNLILGDPELLDAGGLKWSRTEKPSDTPVPSSEPGLS
jgi:hypothetical protein